MTQHKDYQEFGRHVFQRLTECILKACHFISVEALTDDAVKAGLMAYVPFDPDKHDIPDADEFEPGDMIYYWDPQ